MKGQPLAPNRSRIYIVEGKIRISPGYYDDWDKAETNPLFCVVRAILLFSRISKQMLPIAGLLVSGRSAIFSVSLAAPEEFVSIVRMSFEKWAMESAPFGRFHSDCI